ncbi:MAG: hypothetical protein K9M80_03005 [Candidatus Marinimicrobia bacterium]|nr:hypothetical protein [Candidatus Neomarinimicrobiota bacterium]
MNQIENFNLHHILNKLSNQRPIFYSEADFKHALAWFIQNLYKNAKIRLEVPFSKSKQSRYLDLLVKLNRNSIPIEIKYKTRELSVNLEDESYNLKGQGAQDLGRYDFFKDIQRIEHWIKNNNKCYGWIVFLTNDSAYWKAPGRPNVSYKNFRMEDGRKVSGTLTWNKNAGSGTTKNREDPIHLKNQYPLNWKDYSSFNKPGYSVFKYLAINVINR